MENIILFTDPARTRSVWLWMKRDGKRTLPRRHHFHKGQPGDLFLSKLAALTVDLADLDEDGNLPITEAAARVRAALDIEAVTKRFFKDFQEEHAAISVRRQVGTGPLSGLELSCPGGSLPLMYVKEIHLENLKSFKELRFDFERPDGSFPGWTVFVGGNSSGKSTLLKSIALTLMGPDPGKQLMGQAQGWIQEGLRKAAATAVVQPDSAVDSFKPGGRPPGPFPAAVRWQFENKDDLVPEFRRAPLPKSKRTDSAERGPWNPNASGWFSAGYGPMRRLTGSSTDSVRLSMGRGIEPRFVTLFREDAALSESEGWLKMIYSRSVDPHGPQSSRAAQAVLLEGVRSLLSDGLLPHGMKLSTITVDHVFVKDQSGLELPMRDISDGCRSIFATVLDLVHGMFEVYGADGLFGRDAEDHPVVSKPGVAIIDEIEAHLHPQWQKDIPYWLKQHFPQVQFLVSTHSPLVAQAADEGGLFVLPLQNESSRQPRKLSGREFENIRWGRAEKTLLGSAFGLKSTRSRWAVQQIERWQLLDAKKHAGARLTGDESRQHRQLATQLEFALEPLKEF